MSKPPHHVLPSISLLEAKVTTPYLPWFLLGKESDLLDSSSKEVRENTINCLNHDHLNSQQRIKRAVHADEILAWPTNRIKESDLDYWKIGSNFKHLKDKWYRRKDWVNKGALEESLISTGMLTGKVSPVHAFSAGVRLPLPSQLSYALEIPTKLKVPSLCQRFIFYQFKDSFLFPVNICSVSTEQMLKERGNVWEPFFSPLSSKRLFRKQRKELFLALYSQVRRMTLQNTFSIQIFLKETNFDLTHYVLKFKANLLKTGKCELYIVCYFFSFCLPLIYLCVYFTFAYVLSPQVERKCYVSFSKGRFSTEF